MAPPSPLRLYRLQHGVTLVAAAFVAGISLNRASKIERDVLNAPEEASRLRRAVDTLAGSAGNE